MPEGPSRAHRTAWGEYFQRCMADAGFAGVEQIAAGSNFVSARRLIGSALLDRLIKEWVEGTELDPLPNFSGGVALFADSELLIQPTCCGDLTNLEEWDRVIVDKPATGSIWIGHPDLRFAIEGELVTITEQWEYPPAPENLLAVTVPLDLLAEAVKAARAELDLFWTELSSVVARSRRSRVQ